MALVAEAGYDMPARDRRHEQSAAWPEIVDWVTYLDLETKSARTQYAYIRETAPLLRTHPGKRLSDFTAADINAELHKKPPRSRYITRSIYKQLFDWAEFHDVIERSPMGKVARPKAGHRRPKDIFDACEIAALIALPIPDGPLFQILFGTGLRGEEARRLLRSHIELARMRVHVYDGKSNKDRIVPFGTSVAAAVADLDLFERVEPTDHVWHLARYPVGDRRRRRDPISSTTWDRWWRKKLAEADVGRRGGKLLNPHQSRHTYHWLLRAKGLDLEDRQALLGHESPETTVRQYGRVDVEELAAKVAGL